MGTETAGARERRIRDMQDGAWDQPHARRPDQPAPPSRPPATRLCWVQTSNPRVDLPGLLIARRQQDGGWEGLVVMARLDDEGAVTTVQKWLPFEQLRRAG